MIFFLNFFREKVGLSSSSVLPEIYRSPGLAENHLVVRQGINVEASVYCTP